MHNAHSAACAVLLLALVAGTAGCSRATPTLPEGHPTSAVALPTGESACSSQRAACHVSGAPMPPEIAASLATPTAVEAGQLATAAPVQAASASASAATPVSALPAEAPTTDPDSRAADEHGDYVEVAWGAEVTFDEMIEMAKRGEIVVIEWYAMPNAIRLVTHDRHYYHVKNEKYGRSARKELVAAGVKVDKGGIPLNYYFCN